MNNWIKLDSGVIINLDKAIWMFKNEEWKSIYFNDDLGDIQITENDFKNICKKIGIKND